MKEPRMDQLSCIWHPSLETLTSHLYSLRRESPFTCQTREGSKQFIWHQWLETWMLLSLFFKREKKWTYEPMKVLLHFTWLSSQINRTSWKSFWVTEQMLLSKQVKWRKLLFMTVQKYPMVMFVLIYSLSLVLQSMKRMKRERLLFMSQLDMETFRLQWCYWWMEQTLLFWTNWEKMSCISLQRNVIFQSLRTSYNMSWLQHRKRLRRSWSTKGTRRASPVFITQPV